MGYIIAPPVSFEVDARTDYYTIIIIINIIYIVGLLILGPSIISIITIITFIINT